MADIPFAVANIEFAVPTEYERDALQTPADSGFVQKRSTYERPVRRIPLSWSRADRAVAFDLNWLWRETLGGVLPMTWTPPAGDAAFDVRFVGRPEIVLDRRSLDVFRVSCELEEVL